MIPQLAALGGGGLGGVLGNPNGVGGAGANAYAALEGQMSQMLQEQEQVGMMMTMFQTQSSILGTIVQGLQHAAQTIH